MKKIFFVLFCLMSVVAFGQSRMTKEEEADMEKLNLLMMPVEVKYNALMLEIEQAGSRLQEDAAYGLEIVSRMDEVQNETRIIMKQFVTENPNSKLSITLIRNLMQGEVEPDEIDTLYASLSEQLRNTREGKNLAMIIESERKTAVKTIAPDFVQPNADNNPVRLSDFRGKYVLLDFWASWCGPCRKENPNLVNAYEQFKGDNFEILGVSLDNPGQREAWLNAVRRDGLTWPQVSDLKGWENEAAQLYSVFSIPKNFLIDPEGVIVAKDLRGDKLIRVLSEILKQP